MCKGGGGSKYQAPSAHITATDIHRWRILKLCIIEKNKMIVASFVDFLSVSPPSTELLYYVIPSAYCNVSAVAVNQLAVSLFSNTRSAAHLEDIICGPHWDCGKNFPINIDSFVLLSQFSYKSFLKKFSCSCYL